MINQIENNISFFPRLTKSNQIQPLLMLKPGHIQGKKSNLFIMTQKSRLQGLFTYKTIYAVKFYSLNWTVKIEL